MSIRCLKSNGQRGNALVEFALAAVLLSTVFTGTFQYGYTFYVYNSLVTSVRDATRYASLRGLANNSDMTTPTAFVTDVQNMAVFGTTSPAVGAKPIAPGLSPSNIVVSVAFIAGPTPRQVTVGITGYSVDAIFQTYTFNGKPKLTMPYLGSYCSGGTACP